ncbi:hypothetical protein PHET_02501 [Paragonimus heterotremus]|uniref:Uncharacterized protein n=1 Tax=Paragonimus heterotremus TaxID=100268 RepID=A0A8J4WJT1_9TREM|nr:hypothetical protein PHET_02501 [Paragonimus heterotremus]
MCLPKLHYHTFRLNNKNAEGSVSVQRGADEQSQEERKKRTRLEWISKKSHELPVKGKHKKSHSVDFLGASRTMLQRFRERVVEVLRIHSKSKTSFNSDQKELENEFEAASNNNVHSELVTTQSCPSIPTQKPCLHMKFINSKKWATGPKTLKRTSIRTNESSEQQLNTSSQLTYTNSFEPSSTALDSLQETDIDYSQLSSLQDQMTFHLNDNSEYSNLSSCYEDSGLASVGTVLSDCSEDLKSMDAQRHPLKRIIKTVDERQAKFMFTAQDLADTIDQYSTVASRNVPVASETIWNEEVQQNLHSRQIIYLHDPHESKTDSLTELSHNEVNNHALSSETPHILCNSPGVILDSHEPPPCYEIKREGDDLAFFHEMTGVAQDEKYTFKPYLNSTFRGKMDLPENAVFSSPENSKTLIGHDFCESQRIISEVKQSNISKFNDNSINDTFYSSPETAEINPNSSSAHELRLSLLACCSSTQQQQDNDNVKLGNSLPSAHTFKQILETSRVQDVKSVIGHLKCAASTERDSQSLCTEKIELNFLLRPEEVVTESVVKPISSTNLNVNESHDGCEGQISTDFLLEETVKVFQLSEDTIHPSLQLSKTVTQVAEMQLSSGVAQNFNRTLTKNKSLAGSTSKDLDRFSEAIISPSNPGNLKGYDEQTEIMVLTSLQKEDFVTTGRGTNTFDHSQGKQEHLLTQSPRVTSVEQHAFGMTPAVVSELCCENEGFIFEEVEKQTDIVTPLFQLPLDNNDPVTWCWRLNTGSQITNLSQNVQFNCASERHRSPQSSIIDATDRVQDWTISDYNPSYERFPNLYDKQIKEKEPNAVVVVMPICLSQQQLCGGVGYLNCDQSSIKGLPSTTTGLLEDSAVFNSTNLPSISYNESNESDSLCMNNPLSTEEITKDLIYLETTSENELDIREDVKATTTTVAAYINTTINQIPREKSILHVHRSSQDGNGTYTAVSELKGLTTMISQTENIQPCLIAGEEHVFASSDQTWSATELAEHQKTKRKNTENSQVQAADHSRKVANNTVTFHSEEHDLCRYNKHRAMVNNQGPEVWRF